MRTPKALFVILILLVTGLQFPLAIADPGWLTGWKYRVKITIDSGDVDTALTDFPILIYLNYSSGINGEDITFVFDEIGANYLKIAVTLSDGTTECYVEIEKWDLGNEHAWIWTKISAISNITDTEIYLYYDNDHADNNANVGVVESVPGEAVWDANFKAVYHLKETGANPQVKDSTDNNADSAANTANPTTSGKIDGATDFIAASSDFTTLTNSQNAAEGTVEAWVKWDIVDGARRPIIDDDGAGYLVLTLNTGADTDNKVLFQTYDTAAHWAKSTTTPNVGTFYHCAGVYKNGEVARIYVNGVDEGQSAAAMTGNIGSVATALKLGKWGDWYFDGVIDEVRVSNVKRTAAWIKATYESGRDDLLDYGAEEERPALETPNKLFGAGFNGSTPVVHLYWKTNLTGITLFEVQNSTDKISWEYLGQSTTNQYTDLQVTNGLERFYRIRACNYTGGAWVNSTWSDVNFETVYFIPGMNVTGAWVEFNYTSIKTLIGIDSGGNFLNATYWKDSYFYNVTEPNETPAYDIRFNITGLPDNLICLQLINYLIYDGSAGHTFQIEVWNFTGSNWDFVVDIPDECCQWFNNSLDSTPEDYIKDGLFMGRYYHPSPGNINHVFNLDYGKLLAYAPYEVPPCEEVAPAQAMSKYYALAIILLILGILLGLGMRKR